MGFIFHDPSPRCCRGIAAKVVASLPDEVVPVLVSVDMPEVEIVALSDLRAFPRFSYTAPKVLTFA